jgi:D-alanyl-D-alanine carboxypeptidase
MSEESYSSPRAEILEALQSTLQSGIDAGIPGLSAAISTSNGIIWQSTAGYANIVSQEPINSNHVFGIGSITKVFVAVVILQLVDENRLRITDLVEDYLEDEVLQDIEYAGEATIGGLLIHQLVLRVGRIIQNGLLRQGARSWIRRGFGVRRMPWSISDVPCL